MSKGGGSQTVTNVTKLPPWVDKAAQDNLTFANQVANRPFDSYDGQTLADFSPDQLAAFEAVRDNTGKYAGVIDQGIAGFSDLSNRAQGLLNPYLANVEGYALDAVNRSGSIAQNQLADRADAANAFGGSRYGIQAATLAGETAQKAGQISATIRSEGWDKALAGALAQAGGMVSAGQTGQQVSSAAIGDLLRAGLIQQGQDQTGLDQAAQRWQTEYDYPLEQLAIRQSGLTSTPYGSSTKSTQPTNSNPVASALGAASTIGQLGYLGYLAFSDPRLKSDAVPVGIRPDGIPLWRFRYTDGDREFIGVMADEVRAIRPDAVMRGADGFDRVDYAALGMRMVPLPAAV